MPTIWKYGVPWCGQLFCISILYKIVKVCFLKVSSLHNGVWTAHILYGEGDCSVSELFKLYLLSCWLLYTLNILSDFFKIMLSAFYGFEKC